MVFIYSVVLVSDEQQCDFFFCRLYFIIGYDKILNVVPCAIQ